MSLPKDKKEELMAGSIEVTEFMKHLGSNFEKHLKITFPIIDEIAICKVKILKSGKPVFANFEGKDSFYVRNGNSSIPKNRAEQSEYEKLHWK
jgi:hypothetical protein